MLYNLLRKGTGNAIPVMPSVRDIEIASPCQRVDAISFCYYGYLCKIKQ